MFIREVTKEDVYELRHRILRPKMPIEEIMYDTDNENSTFHLGAYIDDVLVGIASFNFEVNKDLPDYKQFRLRAMAVTPECRNKGVGKMIVLNAIDKLKTTDTKILWCKGRTNVIGYYNKLGFEAFGSSFDYPGIGEHIILFKNI
jgi:predicted GNAT family N-acyltransferase